MKEFRNLIKKCNTGELENFTQSNKPQIKMFLTGPPNALFQFHPWKERHSWLI